MGIGIGRHQVASKCLRRQSGGSALKVVDSNTKKTLSTTGRVQISQNLNEPIIQAIE